MKCRMQAVLLLIIIGFLNHNLEATTFEEHVYKIKEIVEDAECNLPSHNPKRFKPLIYKLEYLEEHETNPEYKGNLAWIRHLLNFLEQFKISLSVLPKKHLSNWLYFTTQFWNSSCLIIKTTLWLSPLIFYLYLLTIAIPELQNDILSISAYLLVVPFVAFSGFFSFRSAKDGIKTIKVFNNYFEVLNHHFSKQEAERVIKYFLIEKNPSTINFKKE